MNWKTARKLIVLVVGGTVVLCGMAMIVLPGPAIVVLPVGFMILAGEFAWARRFYRRLRSLAEIAEPDRADEDDKEDDDEEGGEGLVAGEPRDLEARRVAAQAAARPR